MKSPQTPLSVTAEPADELTLEERLILEADLCRNEGANDIAKLLDEAVRAIVELAALAKPTAPINVAAQEHGRMPSASGGTGVGQTDDGALTSGPGMRARNAEGSPPVAATPNKPTAEGAPALRDALRKLSDAVSAERANTEHYIMTGRRFRSVKDMSDAVSSALDEARAALASVQPVPAPSWREAVEFACHQLEKQRVWAGMQWHYNPIPPFQYKPALESLRALLKAHPVAPAPSADSEEKR